MTTHSISKKDISISNFKAKLLQFVNPSFCSILPSLIMAYFSSVSKIALNISNSAHTIALLRIGANLCGLGAGRGWACRAGEGVRRGGAEVAEPLTLRSRPRRCAGARRHWAVGVRPGRSPPKRCGRAETTCRCTAAPPPAEEDRRLRDTGGQMRAVGGGRSCGLRSSWGLGTRGQCTRPRCPAWDNWKIGRLKLKWDGPNSKKRSSKLFLGQISG